MQLFYASSSYEDLTYANAIQVRNMTLAFAKVLDVTLVMKAGDSTLDWPKNVSIKRIKAGKGKFYNVQYSIKAFLYFLKRKNKYQYVFSRNTLFSLLCGRSKSTLVHCYEFHTFVDGFLAGIYQKLLLKRTDLSITISSALRDKISSLPSTGGYHIQVFHDAHSNTSIHQVKQSGNTKKVGYFGSINDLKGEQLLKDLIEIAGDLRFYIFSPDIDKLTPKANIVEYKYLSYELILPKMAEMDFLLMINVPRGNDRDITLYTSPLKLFEYMSVGGVTIASNNPPLLEIIRHGENGYIVDNVAKLWYDAIIKLSKNDNLFRTISSGALETAKKYTWTSRVNEIVSLMDSSKMKIY